MDISIQNPCNLEIETTHTSSSSQKEEVTITRNWLELPLDVLSLIFLKLGTIGILVKAQWVCSSWWKFSKQPYLFHSIHVEPVLTIFGRRTGLSPYSTIKFSEGLAREAIDRSCGQLVQFSVNFIATDELLLYMSEKSSSLRCLRLKIDEECVTDTGLIEMAENLPHLEELVIIQYYSEFSKDLFETFGNFCPNLKPCWIIDPGYYFPVIEFELVALAISDNMPELRRLHLFGNSLRDNDLREILDGCPHLESLDLCQCFDLEFERDLKERCGNIKSFKVSNDPPTDDFEGY